MNSMPGKLAPLDELILQSATLLKKRLGHGQLRRVELTRNGDVQLEWADGAVSRWFEWADGNARELLLHEDRKLPLLKLLSDPDRARHLRVLAWRPGRRVTLLDSSAIKPHVHKGYRVKRLQRALARHENAQHALQGTRVCAPEIIDVDTETGSLMMLYHEGHRLSLSSESARLFRVVGRALKTFQQSATDHDFETFEARDELEVIGKRLERLKVFDDPPSPSWFELFDRLAGLSKDLPPPVTGLAHRDLHDKQLVIEGRQVVMLDFDLSCIADRLLDPGNFLAHLVLRRIQGVMGASQQSIDVCSERFLDGLRGTESPGAWQRLRFYQASSFCRLALVYRLRPQWRHLVPDLTGIGHRCLDDLKRINSR